MFAQNPKKEFAIAYDLESIKKAVHTIITKEPSKYSLVKDDAILNQIRFHEKGAAWDIGYHIDFTFKKNTDTETNVAVEVSRKLGSINDPSEVHNSNYILKEITDKFSAYLSGTLTDDGKAAIPKNDGCIGSVVLFIIITLWFIIGCTKNNQKCWVCDVTQMPSNKVEVCNGSSTPPTTWTDGVGNSAAVSNCKRN